MNARARSRSPRQAQLSSKEIARLIFAREQARLAKDWNQADNLRSQLQEGGVLLYDKTRLWKCSDGRSGRIPSFDEVEAGQVEPVYEDAKEEVDGSKEEIQSLVLQREQARGSKDFQQADAIRSQLQDLGVELLDKEKLWKCPSRGMQGIITGFRSNELSDVEVHTLVMQREKARMGNDYDLSDMIRDELKSRGVTIEDKQKVWQCTDGRRGAVPSWAQITGEVPNAMPDVRPIPAHMPRSGIPQAPMARQPARPSIEDELVSLAVAAARHPDTASRALQALRQVFAGGAATAPMAVAQPALPAAPRIQKAPSSRPEGHPDFNKAMQAIRRIKDGHGVSDEEIEWLVATRERFRMTKDYGNSDGLRKELLSVGIELLEKEKRWTFEDGRSGNIPLWSDIA